MRQWNTWLRQGAQIVGGAAALILSAGCIAAASEPKDMAKAFHLPSQPLTAALETFAQVSNRELLYNGSIAQNKRSSEVDGRYAPEVALDILLAGTGLRIEAKDAGFFAIALADIAPAPSREAAEAIGRRYYAGIQAALRRAFCRMPGDQRFAARLWVGQSGEVLQAKSLGSTAEERRRIEATLHNLQIGRPPAHFAQPITIVMQSDASASDCGSQTERMGGLLQ